MSELASPPAPPESPGAAEDGVSDLALLAILAEVILLGVTLIIGRLLGRAKITFIGEAGAALLLGLVVGLIIRVAGVGPTFAHDIAFNPDLFLYVLLPTIMFDAGYSLDPKPFIRNLGSVCMYAFLGTTIATFIVGAMMYGFAALGWCAEIGAIYNFMFGAIISATDPVTVLAIFSQLRANEDLYINVFGESVLNDAVAMVLYNTLGTFVTNPVTATSVLRGIGIFIGIFTGSVVFGLTVGFVAALLFRTTWFRDEDNSLIETGMVVVLAFVSYLGAQAAYMSGICSVLFCGMFMRSFVRPNLSVMTEMRVEALFKVLSGLFELFLFVYIGLTLFLEPQEYDVWNFTALVLLALAVSRACNIVPLSALVNLVRVPERRVPAKQQFMLWWSGLRGAMAFALSIDAAEKYGAPGAIMKTCTFYVIFVTVLINGGSCMTLLNRLDLRQPPDADLDDDIEVADGDGGGEDSGSGGAERRVHGEHVSAPPGADDVGSVFTRYSYGPLTRVDGSLERNSAAQAAGSPHANGSGNGNGAAGNGHAAGSVATRSMPPLPRRSNIQRLREFAGEKFDNHMEALGRNLSRHLLLNPDSVHGSSASVGRSSQPVGSASGGRAAAAQNGSGAGNGRRGGNGALATMTMPVRRATPTITEGEGGSNGAGGIRRTSAGGGVATAEGVPAAAGAFQRISRPSQEPQPVAEMSPLPAQPGSPFNRLSKPPSNTTSAPTQVGLEEPLFNSLDRAMSDAAEPLGVPQPLNPPLDGDSASGVQGADEFEGR